MKLIVSILDGVFVAADKLVRKLGISRVELFARALREQRRMQRDVNTTQALDKFYSNIVDRADTYPMCEATRATLLRNDWQ